METPSEFVAINFIQCDEDYKNRFEELFTSRAHAIDAMAGFKNMQVLKLKDNSGDYLVVSYWKDEMSFRKWTGSPEFLEGHKRAFADLELAKKEGRTPPMKSTFKIYDVLTK